MFDATLGRGRDELNWNNGSISLASNSSSFYQIRKSLGGPSRICAGKKTVNVIFAAIIFKFNHMRTFVSKLWGCKSYRIVKVGSKTK